MDTYRINHIFYTLQGEGRHTGRAAAFVRFAGCNLACSFCDTDFSSYTEMTAADIVSSVSRWPARFVVLTGGEPTLQVDEALVDALHAAGFTIAMESNGTRRPPIGIDHLTLSPKAGSRLFDGWQTEFAEMKVVFTSEEAFADLLGTIDMPEHIGPQQSLYLQPCDTGDAERNATIVRDAVDYVRRHPEWRLSLQTHKLIGIE